MDCILFEMANSVYFVSVVKRNTVQEWCIKNEFELVELSPLKSNDDEEYEGK